MKTIKVPFTVNTLYTPDAPKQGQADVTVYASVKEAVHQLGSDEALELLNYAQRLRDLRAARARFICLHEGPEKIRLLAERKKA